MCFAHVNHFVDSLLPLMAADEQRWIFLRGPEQLSAVGNIQHFLIISVCDFSVRLQIEY